MLRRRPDGQAVRASDGRALLGDLSGQGRKLGGRGCPLGENDGMLCRDSPLRAEQRLRCKVDVESVPAEPIRWLYRG